MSSSIMRNMTITHAEYFRLLPIALKNYIYQIHDLKINVELDKGNLVIELSPESSRSIGSLTLTETRVTYTFNNCTQDIRNKFFVDFDRVYQKGGG